MGESQLHSDSGVAVQQQEEEEQDGAKGQMGVSAAKKRKAVQALTQPPARFTPLSRQRRL